MIFSNGGITQLGGTAMDNILEITQILNAFRGRAAENGEEEDFADTAIALAGRLSLLTGDQVQAFLDSLPRGHVPIDDVMKMFDEYAEGLEQ